MKNKQHSCSRKKSALLTFHNLKLGFVYTSFKHHNAHLKQYNIIYNETDIIFLLKNLTVTSLAAFIDFISHEL